MAPSASNLYFVTNETSGPRTVSGDLARMNPESAPGTTPRDRERTNSLRIVPSRMSTKPCRNPGTGSETTYPDTSSCFRFSSGSLLNSSAVRNFSSAASLMDPPTRRPGRLLAHARRDRPDPLLRPLPAAGPPVLEDSRQHRDHDDGEDDEVELFLDEGQLGEVVARRQEREDPENAPGDVEESEAGIAHLADPGDEGGEGPDDGNEPREDDRLPAVP